MEYRKMTTAKSDVIQLQRPVVVCILFLLLAALSVLSLLSAKIYTLEKRIHDVEMQLGEDNVGKVDTILPSTDLTLSDSDEFIETNRVKRSGKRKKNKIYGCHLIGDSGRSSRDRLSASFPLIRDYSSTGACQMKVDYVDSGPYVKSIRITESGYYLVYAHVTMQGLAKDIFGFKTAVRKLNCLPACEKKSLMSTVKTLRNGDVNESKESGYHAGLFYLKKNHEIFLERVEPIIYSQDFDLDKARLYFGAIFMQRHTF